MSNVSVSELKARLSHYIRLVKKGGEVQVLDRGVPVARLTGLGPLSAGDGDQRRARLVAAGVISPGSGDASWVLATPPLAYKGPSISAALDEGREDRV